jgi:hypothetical protein
MGEKLDKVDRQIDANAIILERCLDSCVQICNKYSTIALYGDDKSVLSDNGIFQLTVALFERVRSAGDVGSLLSGDQSMEELIAEYAKEKGGEREEVVALEERHADNAGVTGP